MALKHILKLSSINEFLDNDNKIIKKGENALESNHVKRMQFDADLMMIRGEVHASMKDKFYHVEVSHMPCLGFPFLLNSIFLQITLNKSGDIVSANCACPRGIKCHHIATLALFGHYNISVTDKECSWNVPKSKNVAVKTAEELYPSKPYSAIKQVMSEEQIDHLKKKLNDFGNTVGFMWLLQEDNEESVNCDLPVIEDIVSSKEFVEATNPIEFFKKKCSLDDEMIKKIAEITKGQSQNEKWYLMRKFRLTASNFGAVISSCKRNKFPESLFKSLIGETSFLVFLQ